MHRINGKGQKSELRSSRNVLTNHVKSKSLVFYGLGSGHTHTHTQFGGMKVISRNQAQPGLKLLFNEQLASLLLHKLMKPDAE